MRESLGPTLEVPPVVAPPKLEILKLKLMKFTCKAVPWKLEHLTFPVMISKVATLVLLVSGKQYRS
jgi:hypothetical protein